MNERDAVSGASGEDRTGKVRSWDLVEHLFDASVSPERLDELIAVWDAQIASVGPEQAVRLADFAGSAFAHQIGGVLQILEQLHAAELAPRQRPALDDPRRGDGARRRRRGPGGQRRRRQPLRPAARRLDPRHAARRARISTSSRERSPRSRPRPAPAARTSCSCAPPGSTGWCWCISRRCRRRGRPHVLAVTSELAWPEAVSEFLARVFALTPAEVEVMRLLVAGGTVAGIAAATGRSRRHRALAAPRHPAEDRHPQPGRGGAPRRSC